MVFTGALSVWAVEQIAARARMGIEVKERLILLFQGGNNQALHGVLEHVGVVAGVVTVAITQHEEDFR